MDKMRIALIGNPNVGKSTVFNALTGEKQHTGNWSGKTVESAQGALSYEDISIEITDLPGAYSLTNTDSEEAVTGGAVLSGGFDAVIIVCDATVLERNLIIALQAANCAPRVVLCLNMVDEAKKMNVQIDTARLSDLLGMQTVECCARENIGMSELLSAVIYSPVREVSPVIPDIDDDMVSRAQAIAAQTIQMPSRERDMRIDRILTGRYTALPVMLLLLSLILFITMLGANYPSELLMYLFEKLGILLRSGMDIIHSPAWLTGILCDGIYRTVTWVAAVMLPPMAIFFPLFTLLEDAGFLPRIAFNLDRYCKKAGACGKQALTMCMGFGCNSVGVTGCRIIRSVREKKIAQTTNSFMPCNGKFPTMIAIITMFITAGTNGIMPKLLAAPVLTACIAAAVCTSLAVSKFLSVYVYRGDASAFVLEMPPYRKPQIGRVIVTSLRDRTLRVLLRAVCVAAPAGAVIWLAANVQAGGVSILSRIADFLNPVGRFLGLDGVMLIAFILGFPANEIVMPVAITAYTGAGVLTGITDNAALHELLTQHGWTAVTAVCALMFTMFHWPCSTTCITLYKETKSLKDTLIAVLLPTCVGLVICALTAQVMRLIGLY